MADEPEVTAIKAKGWPKGKLRGPRKVSLSKPSVQQTDLGSQIESAETFRPQMHAPMRPDSIRDAASRAAEIMDHLGTIPDAADSFYVPDRYKADGYDYNWKTFTIHNQEQTTHLNKLRDTGWEPVPADFHRNDGSNIVPVGYPMTEKRIIRDGNILMMRPKVISAMMKKRDSQAAKTLLDIAGRVDPNKVQHFDLDNAGSPIRSHGVTGAKKTYSAMPIPD